MTELTPSELKPIITAWGGPEKFSAMLEVSPRLVYYWLSGERRVKPPLARLIRMLSPPELAGEMREKRKQGLVTKEGTCRE